MMIRMDAGAIQMLGRTIAALVLIVAGFGVGYLSNQTQEDASTSSSLYSHSRQTNAEGSPAEPSSRDSKRAQAKTASSVVIPVVKSLAETAEISSEFLQSAALYQLAAPLDANGILELLDEAKTAFDETDYQGATALLIGRLAELDFAAALDSASVGNGKMRTNWLRAIFHARARIDFDDALQQALTLSKRQQQIAGIAMLRSTGTLSKSQRQTVVDALQLPGQMVVAAQFQSAEAWTAAQNIADPNQRAAAQMQVLMAWAQSDPWAAIDASKDIENDQVLLGVQGQLLAAAAADDYQRAIDWIDPQPEGQRRDDLTSTLIAQIGINDIEQAQALLQRLPADKRSKAEMSLWTRRGVSDPEGAAAWVARLPENSDGSSPILFGNLASMQVLQVISMSSPDAAERFMTALPADKRSDLAPTYVQTLARQNSEKALEWIESLGNDATPELYEKLGSSWARTNVASARRYAEEMRSGSERDHLYSGIVTSGRLPADDVGAFVREIGDPKLRARAEQMQQVLERSRLGLRAGSSSVLFRSSSDNNSPDRDN